MTISPFSGECCHLEVMGKERYGAEDQIDRYSRRLVIGRLSYFQSLPLGFGSLMVLAVSPDPEPATA